MPAAFVLGMNKTLAPWPGLVFAGFRWLVLMQSCHPCSCSGSLLGEASCRGFNIHTSKPSDRC